MYCRDGHVPGFSGTAQHSTRACASTPFKIFLASTAQHTKISILSTLLAHEPHFFIKFVFCVDLYMYWLQFFSVNNYILVENHICFQVRTVHFNKKTENHIWCHFSNNLFFIMHSTRHIFGTLPLFSGTAQHSTRHIFGTWLSTWPAQHMAISD